MKRISIPLILLVLLLANANYSCKKEPELRVGLVSGFGSLHDGGFNEMALNGLMAADDELAISWDVKECNTIADIESNIWLFARGDFDVIIALGFNAVTPIVDAAKAYPGKKFILIDYALEPTPENITSVVYQVDEASFPCGYLAAWWSNQKDSVNPVVGYVAGPKIPEIDQFTVSFAKGIEYFNTRYHKSVDLLGVNATDFNDTLQGARLADSLIQKGAKVIFACGGHMGNGALYKAKEYGISAIGVDSDQYYTIPAIAPILLTSCMKRLDNSVYMELKSIFNNQYHGGQILHSDLENNGVDLAPYHDYESQISNTIKNEIQAIKSGIKNGTISTGWK
jgi:basic membrane protein A